MTNRLKNKTIDVAGVKFSLEKALIARLLMLEGRLELLEQDLIKKQIIKHGTAASCFIPDLRQFLKEL